MAETININNGGVYEKNIDVRNTHLERGDKYAMYTETLSPAIGEIYNPYWKDGKTFFRLGEGGLLEETISDKKELGKYLNEHYYTTTEDKEVYQVPVVSSELMHPFMGRYSDYSEYMDKIGQLSVAKQVIGAMAQWQDSLHDITSFTAIVGDFEQLFDTYFNANGYTSIITAMEVNRPGIVRSFKIRNALEGAITTNVNNYSGEDSRLGTLTNSIYSRILRGASNFNTARNTHYITDYLKETYGLNQYTIYNVTDILNVSDKTGKAPELDNNSYIEDLTTAYNGELSDYNNSIDEFTDYSTKYNRYKNIIENPGNTFSEEYRSSHNVYNPFSEYYEDTLGNSIDRKGVDTQSTMVDKTVYSYNEGDSTNWSDSTSQVTVDGETFTTGDEVFKNENGLLNKTNTLFRNHKIGTLVGRFHTDNNSEDTTKASLTQSAVSSFGLSHGRNLLAKNTNTKEDPYGYTNPYCRVWTYYHQYSKYSDLIRPFGDKDTIDSLQSDWIDDTITTGSSKGLRTQTGPTRLSDYGTMSNAGFVNIAPTVKGAHASGVDVKKCMFSIENLAWKDVNKTEMMNGGYDQVLSPEQIGPNGGRIMWFPPYDLNFSENVSASWNSTNFIGRGEPVYTYTNTQRTGQLEFTLLVDHPSIVDSWGRGKDASVDENEQDLLRFFAGCSTLTPGTLDNSVKHYSLQKKLEEALTTIVTSKNSNTDDESINNNEKRVKTETIYKTIYLFFPNNYSGVDQRTAKQGASIDDVIDYLMFGTDSDITSSYNGYEICNNGITSDECTDKWGYRIDKKYETQVLAKGNYKDTASFKLNSNLEALISSAKGYDDANYSFAELYAATTDSESKKNYLISCGANSDRIEELEDIFENATITEIKVHGGASSHGYSTENLDSLSNNRATTLQEWIKNNRYISTTNVVIDKSGEEKSTNNSNNVSSIEAKVGRYARLVIAYSLPEMTVQTDDTSTINEEYERIISNAVIDTTKKVVEYQTDSTTTNSQSSNRYDYEQAYFQQLGVEDPIMHKKLVEKVKYFDPAFHSITPEGFNARLTFLHQCTRQGHTLSAADSGWGNTAGNLAFGRPPVCVLRLGDFFHCKIIIESVNITYDDGGIQWDLNPEGIGLQPMKCRVSLTIKYLGGSDLASPISRLQNAVSFNYYANTSVYDNRSDYSTSEDGSTMGYEWTPSAEKNK